MASQTPQTPETAEPPIRVTLIEEDEMNANANVNANANDVNEEDEDEDDEQVRRLAASFAPQVRELDVLLSSPPPLIDSARGSRISVLSEDEDEDDGMGSEEQHLEASQNLLRQELEFAHDWTQLMASPLRQQQDHIARELASHYHIEEQEHVVHVEEHKHSYTIANHAETLGLQVDGGWYILQTKLDPTVLEYVVPLPIEHLKRLYLGLAGVEEAATPAAAEEEEQSSSVPPSLRTTPISKRMDLVNRLEPLPVRTVVIWIRPDVLCGAVMDATYHALDFLGRVTKRQGGHLRGVVASRILPNSAGQAQHSPSFLVDAQLCTYKGSHENKRRQRSLLLRVYHHSPNGDTQEDEDTGEMENPLLDPERMNESSNLLLKEAAALVQKMETGSTEMSPRASSFSSLFSPRKVYDDPKEMQNVISRRLLSNYRSCPSVQDGRLTLPALSEQDAPVIHASWRWIDACWNELETRDLCFRTLDTVRFGAFPALPTLDVQYCSQLRRLSRESMIVSLLKAASDLEEYAREAEYACAILIQMLRPTFLEYKIEPPALPQPLPLTAYPLDFTPPQTTCPPWGMKVMEALNKVAVMTSEENAKEGLILAMSAERQRGESVRSSYEMSEDAIRMVMKGFQQQDDEEQGARLGRKNVQVMDRLAKMQAHKRACIAAIRDSYGRNSRVVQAADDFHCKAQQACSADEKSPEDQVPLYKCSVLVRSSTGTCFVTSTQILFVTQFIPIVGGQLCTLFDLAGVEFVLSEGSSSLLNPLPSSVSMLKDGQEVYSFRPSHGAARLVAFLNVVQTVAAPDDEELTFSDRGGLLYLYGDSPPPTRP